jgi:hypothetical protein
VVVHRGVLSPLLWNTVADSLLNRLRSCNCFVYGFADDVVILGDFNAKDNKLRTKLVW